MLDNLFNSILLVSFVVLSAVAAVTIPADQAAPAVQTIAQLERVIVVGQSIKAADKA